MMKVVVFVISFAFVGVNAAPIQVKSREKSSDFRSFEIRTAPIAFLASWITLDGSYRMSENFAFGPSAIIYNASEGDGGMFTPTFKGYAIGANATYYFGSVKKGTWYNSYHIYYDRYDSFPSRSRGRDDHYIEVSGFKGNTAVGYQFKASRFTFLLGGGLEYRIQDETDYKTSFVDGAQTVVSSSESFGLPFIEFKTGFEF